tara:strand:- start:468 stop:1448 length:981 start_codon:yes stop_codon:yes gene_type:complete
MIKAITNYLSEIEFGEIQQFKNMTIIPLFSKINKNYKYLTMKEALDKDLLTVKETDHDGSVPELKVKNKAKIPVFLLDGEELIGAKQNRVLNTSILLKAKSETIIPVSCTEQGRWSYTSDEFHDSGLVMSNKARKLKSRSVGKSLEKSMEFLADQCEVWNGIEKLSDDADVQSPTNSMKDVFESKKEDLEEYLKAFKCLASQTGVVVFVNGKVEGFDIISLNSAYKDIHPKLLKSYAIDSILDRKGKGSTRSLDKAKIFIEKAIKCRGKKYESKGLGSDYRFEANKTVGSALVYSGKVIHTAFFKMSESEKAGRISDLESRKRYRI